MKADTLEKLRDDRFLNINQGRRRKDPKMVHGRKKKLTGS